MLKKIDAHFHVNFCGYTANKIVNYLNEKQIEQCWLYTWEENNPPIPSLYEHLSIEDVLIRRLPSFEYASDKLFLSNVS